MHLGVFEAVRLGVNAVHFVPANQFTLLCYFLMCYLLSFYYLHFLLGG